MPPLRHRHHHARTRCEAQPTADRSTGPTVSSRPSREPIVPREPRAAPSAPPARGRPSQQSVRSAWWRVRPAGSGQRSPVLQPDHRDVGEAAVLEPLQPHALAAGPSQAGRPAGRSASCGCRPRRRRGRPAAETGRSARASARNVSTALPARLEASKLVLGHDEAVARRGGDQQTAAGEVDEHARPTAASCGRVHHQAQRLAHAAPAGQVGGAQRVRPPVRAPDDQPVRRLGVEGEARPRRRLCSAAPCRAPGARPAPAPQTHAGADHTVTGSRSIIASSGTSATSRRLGEAGATRAPAPCPCRRRGARRAARPRSPSTARPSFSSRSSSPARSAISASRSVTQRHLLEPAQGAQAHVEDRLGLHLAQRLLVGGRQWGDVGALVRRPLVGRAPGRVHQRQLRRVRRSGSRRSRDRG